MQRLTERLRAKHDVSLRQVRIATWNVSCIESNIMQICECLGTSIDVARHGWAAVV